MTFGKIWIALSIASGFCTPTFADEPVTVIAPMPFLRQAFAAGDCAAVLQIALNLRRNPHPPTGDDWAWLNTVIVACDEKTGDVAAAYKDALVGTSSNPSSIYVWRMRLKSEFDQKLWNDALRTVEEMAASHRAALNSLPIAVFFSFHRELEQARDLNGDFRLLQLLIDTYRPDEPFADIESLRLIYARKLYDKGQTAKAADLVNATQSFVGLVQVSLDPELRGLQNPKVDLRVAAERQYVEDEITASQHQDSLQGVNQVAADLRRLGRYNDALAKLDSVRSRIDDPNAFSDGFFEIARWWEWHAQNYVQLNDYDQVVATYTTAINRRGPEHPNVDQVLDLALEQTRFGHYDAALATLAMTPEETKFLGNRGLMVFHYAHACATTLAGHRQDSKPDVAYIVAHEKDGPMDAAGSLMCIGDLDGAAAVFIRALSDSENRPDALQTLSDFLPAAANVPRTVFERLLPRIKARPDVRAAITKAGGSLSFPFRESDL